MDNQELINKIAYLESVNDQLMSELSYIDDLAKKIGFIGGINALKSAALELYEEQKNEMNPENPYYYEDQDYDY